MSGKEKPTQNVMEYLGDGLLTPDEASSLLRVDEGTLANWRYRGTGPVFVKLGGKVRYAKNDLNDFVQESRQQMTGHALAA
jgi:predicted site-specific integrase-resolvase